MITTYGSERRANAHFSDLRLKMSKLMQQKRAMYALARCQRG
jgi:hypothetical protein